MPNIDISAYITPGVAIGVYTICAILHNIKSLEKFKDYLPAIAGILGAIFNAWATGSWSFDIFLVGIVSGFAANGIDQFIDIFKKNKNKGDQ